MFARSQIAVLNAAAEFLLLVGGQQRDLVDLLEVRLQAPFGRNGGLLRVGRSVRALGALASTGPTCGGGKIDPGARRS
jgi:hypothetical protein